MGKGVKSLVNLIKRSSLRKEGLTADNVRNKRIGRLESDEDDDDKILGI